MDDDRFRQQLAELEESCIAESDRTKELVARIVSTYKLKQPV